MCFCCLAENGEEYGELPAPPEGHEDSEYGGDEGGVVACPVGALGAGGWSGVVEDIGCDDVFAYDWPVF